MGVGMQIACLGFTGSAAVEAEAGAQLVRLERFRAWIEGCHLAIESRTATDGARRYDVRLDLVMRDATRRPLPPCVGADVDDALRRAFAQAERALLTWQAGAATVALRDAATGDAMQ
ncbi:metal ABC transporter ATPase [Burkholderia sp. AU42008]|uniref:metal ABC transporter ATPase n=1 Tax=unclassified Burkholderia TaxID=2613784 RepID=UPI000B79F694|nr:MULTISPECIES: metal ABC transporter ATPase [unclassified Burkholderia]MBR8233102.1 metal ABC transporter ATPase [Burkholderia sp. AU32357]MBY4873608.1 metal ABC transporter ATPase [Burkholderia sp. AU42008]OXI40750.1 metal ABC transporter ATPase [Burkholderia sp. AU17457]OXI67278.1 metal ABC transporter ATPase [Burkholderia sp. AU28863]